MQSLEEEKKRQTKKNSCYKNKMIIEIENDATDWKNGLILLINYDLIANNSIKHKPLRANN